MATNTNKTMGKNFSIQLIGFILFVLTLSSCEREYMSYDPALKDGVYFPQDSLNFQFGMLKGDQFEYNIPVAVMGKPENRERNFRVELQIDKTTAISGLHYEMANVFVVSANAVTGAIPIKLYRYMDPEITKKAFVLSFRIIENESFRNVMSDTCKLEISDTELPRPKWWSERHFGPYSQLLMMDILNNYWDLETSRPMLFERIAAEYGKDLEKALSFPFQQEIAFVKYIITPAYEYYLEHPHPKVQLPNPDTLL